MDYYITKIRRYADSFVEKHPESKERIDEFIGYVQEMIDGEIPRYLDCTIGVSCASEGSAERNGREVPMPGLVLEDEELGIGEWKIKIDLRTGKILDWPEGVIASTDYKSADCNEVIVLNERNEPMYKYSGYVPNVLCHRGHNFGDYVELDILADGSIKNFSDDILDIIEECNDEFEFD